MSACLKPAATPSHSVPESRLSPSNNRGNGARSGRTPVRQRPAAGAGARRGRTTSTSPSRAMPVRAMLRAAGFAFAKESCSRRPSRFKRGETPRLGRQWRHSRRVTQRPGPPASCGSFECLCVLLTHLKIPPRIPLSAPPGHRIVKWSWESRRKLWKRRPAGTTGERSAC